jgi:hypothetical protein
MSHQTLDIDKLMTVAMTKMIFVVLWETKRVAGKDWMQPSR